jgi:hypothetical protein
MAIPRLRQDAINPREIIVFPEPPRRAAIKIRGKAIGLVSCYWKTTRQSMVCGALKTTQASF